MKKLMYTLSLATLLLNVPAFGQLKPNNHEASFELGKGLNFSFQEGDYSFSLGGMMQPQIQMVQFDGAEADLFLNSRRTYLNFKGEAVREKIDFFLQFDFSNPAPLLDAWVAYHPWQNWTITLGQMQNITNNREMLIMEDKLQFPGRSLLSTSLSRSGREFGVFVETKLALGTVQIIPQLSLTSGDGINSFGADSRDVDFGGVKYGGRLDILPFGEFSEGGLKSIGDVNREENLKMIIGAAASYNDGASNAVGEGHGDLFLYNALGQVQLPDYRQVYTDVLMKYRGFSLLAEYGIATATSLEGSFVDLTGEDPLLATEISNYLALGTALNGQLGYVTQSGYGVDLRYSNTQAEFDLNPNSVLPGSTALGIGLTKYFKGHDLKVQAAFTNQQFDDERPSIVTAELLVQLVF